MDRLLYASFGAESKLKRLLEKLGYELQCFDSSQGSLAQVASEGIIDAVVLEDDAGLEIEDICAYLQTLPEIKELPFLVYSARPATKTFIGQLGLSDFEFLPADLTLGKVAGRIATKLRMRKMKGEGDTKANLGEVNAALRDYNQKVKKELEAARKIQQNLLPQKLPSAAEFEVSVFYDPLDEVGGDWYFVEQCEDGKVAFQIADVTGHGLSAAFICSMTKLAKAASPEREPAALLTSMNSLLAPQLPEGNFITAMSLLYDPGSRELQYARAGHPPALLFRSSDKSVERLLGEGFPLGFFDAADYESLSTPLQVGDLVLLMTDGIPEAQNRSGENYGEDRIIEAVSALYFSDPSVGCVPVIEHVLTNFDTFRQERLLKDDLTLVALRIKG